jgi:hypothetical protein
MLLNDSTLLRCEYHTQFNIAGGQPFASTHGHVVESNYVKQIELMRPIMRHFQTQLEETQQSITELKNQTIYDDLTNLDSPQDHSSDFEQEEQEKSC